jgi:hypothetical protein
MIKKEWDDLSPPRRPRMAVRRSWAAPRRRRDAPGGAENGNDATGSDTDSAQGVTCAARRRVVNQVGGSDDDEVFRSAFFPSGLACLRATGAPALRGNGMW